LRGIPLTEPAGVYRPRHPERTVAYRPFEEHFERYVREYEERYEAREGSLRRVVPTTVEAYLACSRLEGGFARIRWPICRAEHLLAFSCRTRNFCPSCQAKRSALFAEHVGTLIYVGIWVGCNSPISYSKPILAPQQDS